MLLYIIRHGDPDYASDSLTERGKRQAESVGKRLFAAKIDRIFSSPMGRAKQTAEPACRLLNLTCEIEEWTREIEKELCSPFPDGKLKSITNIQNTYYRENGNLNLTYDQAFDCQGINQSDMKRAVAYIEQNGNAFLERLGYREENGIYRITKKNEEKVALFCHAGFARAWMSALFRIPLHMMWSSFAYTHTGVTVIEFRNNENGISAPQCLCYSDMSHLYADGPDTLHNGRVKL